MLHVWGCITQEHDLRLVVLAGILCLFSCATAMSLVARALTVFGNARNIWVAAAGLVGGCGIWATHFIAMLAYEPGFPVAYDTTLTILSVVIAVLMCGVGFRLSISRIGAWAGGAVIGAAIGTMHYVGMAALRVPADAFWDWRYVAASAVIAVAAMAGGMKLVTDHPGWRYRMGGALVFTLAICSMHFTGMSAVVFRLDPAVSIPGAVLAPATLAVAVAAIAVLIVALGLVGSLVDSHLSSRAIAEAANLRAHVLGLEAAKERLEQTSESLQLALDQASAASRAKSAFLAAMGHELRTPLNAVIGFSDMLMTEQFGELGPRNKDYINDIHVSGVRLLSMINDILDMARVDAGNATLHETVSDPVDLVTDSLQIMAPQAAQAQIELIEKHGAVLPLLRVDERRMKKVLGNLLGNAIKFSSAGDQVQVRIFEESGGLAIAVCDTGIGMAEEDIPVARERFGQVDSRLGRRYEGAGLGLPVAIQIVEMHGGRLQIESQLGIGTIVTMHLPQDRLTPRKNSAAA